MIRKPTAEQIIYAAIILLSVIALALGAISPAEFMNNKVVYQGF